MQHRAVDDSINLVTAHCFSAIYVAVAKQSYLIPIQGNYSVNHKVVAVVSQYDIVLAKIFVANRSQYYGRAAEEEWQHALALYRDSYIRAFEQQVTYDREHRSVIYLSNLHYFV